MTGDRAYGGQDGGDMAPPAASIAALFIVGLFVTLNYTTKSSEYDRIDNIIVSYNYIPDTDRAGKASASDTDRGWESITSDDIPTLENAYRTARR